MTLDNTTGAQPAPPSLDPARDALFLDFDGCLVEIAPRPDAVHVPEDLPARLQALYSLLNGALAIVSGRSLHELEWFLDGFSGPMVGSHGAEARGLTPPLEQATDGQEEVQRELALFAHDLGLLYEAKTHGGALHYREAPDLRGQVEAFAEKLVARFPDFEIQPAKMAVELRPAGFSKDGALALLNELPEFSGRRPVYAGDDTTDEPALQWAEAHGGYGIKVGDGDSAASRRLPDPQRVRDWLAAGLEG